MKRGFANRAAGLSFIEPDKFQQYAFLDEDLAHAGLRKLLPWKAEYYRSFLCETCRLYTVDLSAVLDRAEAQRSAHDSMPNQ